MHFHFFSPTTDSWLSGWVSFRFHPFWCRPSILVLTSIICGFMGFPYGLLIKPHTTWKIHLLKYINACKYLQRHEQITMTVRGWVIRETSYWHLKILHTCDNICTCHYSHISLYGDWKKCTYHLQHGLTCYLSAIKAGYCKHTDTAWWHTHKIMCKKKKNATCHLI